MGPYRSLNIPKSSSLYIAQIFFFIAGWDLLFQKQTYQLANISTIVTSHRDDEKLFATFSTESLHDKRITFPCIHYYRRRKGFNVKYKETVSSSISTFLKQFIKISVFFYKFSLVDLLAASLTS